MVHGEFVLMLPTGSITYYDRGNYFVAECDEHKNQRPLCKRTRSAAGSKSGKGPQGRPLGFLAGFLMCCGHGHENAKAHYAVAASLTFEQRREARRRLSAAPGAAIFFEKERPVREGEASEPESSVA